MSDQISALKKELARVRSQKRALEYELREASKALLATELVSTRNCLKSDYEMSEKSALEAFALLLAGTQHPFQVRLGDSHYQFELIDGIPGIPHQATNMPPIWIADLSSRTWLDKTPVQFWEADLVKEIFFEGLKALIAHENSRRETINLGIEPFRGKPEFWALQLKIADAVRVQHDFAPEKEFDELDESWLDSDFGFDEPENHTV